MAGRGAEPSMAASPRTVARMDRSTIRNEPKEEGRNVRHHQPAPRRAVTSRPLPSGPWPSSPAWSPSAPSASPSARASRRRPPAGPSRPTVQASRAVAQRRARIPTRSRPASGRASTVTDYPDQVAARLGTASTVTDYPDQIAARLGESPSLSVIMTESLIADRYGNASYLDRVATEGLLANRYGRRQRLARRQGGPVRRSVRQQRRPSPGASLADKEPCSPLGTTATPPSPAPRSPRPGGPVRRSVQQQPVRRSDPAPLASSRPKDSWQTATATCRTEPGEIVLRNLGRTAASPASAPARRPVTRRASLPRRSRTQARPSTPSPTDPGGRRGGAHHLPPGHRPTPPDGVLASRPHATIGRPMHLDDRFDDLVDSLAGFHTAWLVYLGVELGLFARPARGRAGRTDDRRAGRRRRAAAPRRSRPGPGPPTPTSSRRSTATG